MIHMLAKSDKVTFIKIKHVKFLADHLVSSYTFQNSESPHYTGHVKCTLCNSVMQMI